MSTTLCVKGLPPEIRECELLLLFNSGRNSGETGLATEAHLIKDHETGLCVGYGFIEFATHEAAAKAFNNASDGVELLGRSRFVTVDWASSRVQTPIDEYQIYIGNILPDATEADIIKLIRPFYNGSCRAKVIIDKATMLSRGYGFIHIDSDDRFIGQIIRTVNSSKLDVVLGQQGIVIRQTYRTPSAIESGNKTSKEIRGIDYSNRIVYVCNLPPSATESEMLNIFTPFGSVLSARVLFLKHIAFITFADHVAALAALTHLNGYKLRNQKLYMSWKRGNDIGSPKSKLQSIVDYENLNEERLYNVHWYHSMTPSCIQSSSTGVMKRRLPSTTDSENDIDPSTVKKANIGSDSDEPYDKEYWLSRLTSETMGCNRHVESLSSTVIQRQEDGIELDNLESTDNAAVYRHSTDDATSDQVLGESVVELISENEYEVDELTQHSVSAADKSNTSVTDNNNTSKTSVLTSVLQSDSLDGDLTIAIDKTESVGIMTYKPEICDITDDLDKVHSDHVVDSLLAKFGNYCYINSPSDIR